MNQLYKAFINIFLSFLIICNYSNSYAQISTHAGFGAMYIQGDVDYVFDPLNSFHVSVSKTVHNNFNIELKFGIGKTVGLSGTYMESRENGGELVEDVYAGMGDNVWYPNYLSNYAYADLGVNYILQTGIERLRFIGGAGLGISNSNTSVNLLLNVGDQELRYTTKLPTDISINEAKSTINRSYDSSYETKFNEGGLTPHLSLQFGVQFKIKRGIFFSIDARHHLTTSDYLDPIQNISATEASGNNDSVSMLTFGFVGYLLSDDSDDKSPLNRNSN